MDDSYEAGPSRPRIHPIRVESGADRLKFWAKCAQKVEWFVPFERVLDWNPPFARWFVGGRTNVCYNAVDRHQDRLASKRAIIWESEDGRTSRTITYGDLYDQVQRFANVLKSLGVGAGDRVTIYLPMIPELVVAMLGCARIGAIHVVIFSGFSSASIRERIRDSGSKVIVTADGGYRRGKIVELKRTIDEALAADTEATASVEHVIVVRHTSHKIDISKPQDEYWHILMDTAEPSCPAVHLDSLHPLFILYTSGTTGKPKGVLHGTGGYLTHIYNTFEWAFGADTTTSANDVYFCTADIGWVTGHSYVSYAPLLHGITSVMYEGAPDYPDSSRMWQIIQNYGVTIFYTTPTLLRMLMKSYGGRNVAEVPDLDSLRLLGTVGEPINPEVWRWYFERVGRGRCPIIDTWWQTETGGMIVSNLPNLENIPLKPGSATRPIPGVDIDVLDDEGRPVPASTKGQIVIKNPWPGMLLTLWGDDKRYEETYWRRYPGCYHPGDYARIDEDGYVWFLGRADDILKVAGHRIGTAELEGCIVSHLEVAEAAVCSIPDEIKGESIVAYAVLRSDAKREAERERITDEIVHMIRDEVGAIATPKHIRIVSRLPKTRSGKIMRRLLKAIAMGREVGDTSTLEDADMIGEIRLSSTGSNEK